jgi:hypothetical protein
MSWPLELILNTGRPQSVIGPKIRDALLALDVLEQRTRITYVLVGAQVEGRSLPHLPVRVSAGPALLAVEGMLGLDFLDLFAEVRLDTRSLRLTLVNA